MAAPKEWKARCKVWQNSEGYLYSVSGTAPAPSKNFMQVVVTETELILRIWKIIPPTRADSNQPPAQTKCLYSEFTEEVKSRDEISRTLGNNEMVYLDNLVHYNIDYIVRLPRKVLLRILFKLDLMTITKLGATCKFFQELCSCDSLWSKIYYDTTKKPITQELLMVVDQKGWKEVFFMNKLQLQMQIRRQGEPSRESREEKPSEAEKEKGKKVKIRLSKS